MKRERDREVESCLFSQENLKSFLKKKNIFLAGLFLLFVISYSYDLIRLSLILF